MLVCGLTGGIASGKSFVVDLLRQKGAKIIDLDVLARVVVEPGRPALEDIRRRFGDGVIGEGGKLDRAALGKIVFGDAPARRDLEAILHPRIYEEQNAQAAGFIAQNPRAIVIVDVPLLIEVGLHRGFSHTILIYAPRAVQRERLIARDGFTDLEADQRLDAQMDIEQKRDKVTWVIDNSGAPERTAGEVERVWDLLMAAEARNHEEQVA